MKATSPTFFSYSRDDAEFALTLASDLRSAGAQVWLDQLDIKPGQRWDSAIEDALATCRNVLVVVSPNSINSTNVMDEVSLALEEQKTVIPVIYRDCKVPFRLRRLQHVDFRSDYGKALARLLETFGIAPDQAGHGTQPVNVPSDHSEPDGVRRSENIGTAPPEQPVSILTATLDGVDRNDEPVLQPLEHTQRAETHRPGMHDRHDIKGPYVSLLADAEQTPPVLWTLIRRLQTAPRPARKGAVLSGGLWATIPLLYHYQLIGPHFIGDVWRWQPGTLLNGLYLIVVFGWFESHVPKQRLVLLLAIWPLAVALANFAVPNYLILDFSTSWLFDYGHRFMFVGLVSIAGALTGLVVAWPVKDKRSAGVWLGALSFGIAQLLVTFLFRWSPSYYTFNAIVSYFVTGFFGAGALLWWMYQPAPREIGHETVTLS